MENREQRTPIGSGRVAQILGVNIQTVSTMARTGRLPSWKLGDGPKPRYRFWEEEILEWLAGRTTKPQTVQQAAEDATNREMA